MNKRSIFSNRGITGLMSLALLCYTLCIACGPKFTSHDFFEARGDSGSAGEALSGAGNSGEGGDSGGSGGSNPGDPGGTAGYVGGGAGMAGGNSGGLSGGPSNAGTGGHSSEPATCLAHYETDQCAQVCMKAPPSEAGCIAILECARSKNLPPAQGSLDPCYGMGYQELQRATMAYDNCCK